MLDDLRLISRVDKSDALGFIGKQPQQLLHNFDLKTQKLSVTVKNVVFSGMGGSSLVAELVQSWPALGVPFLVVKGYELPEWVNEETLVICASYSGNTEETLATFEQAKRQNAQIVVLAHGGKLLEHAQSDSLTHAQIPECTQPRTGILYMYRALVELFAAVSLVPAERLGELESVVSPLAAACRQWSAEVATKDNLAKQLAEHMEGKTPIIYGGKLTYPAAYKWKINVNENAKNTAWCNQLPEFNHNEFIGWSLHPVEKPFAVLDLISSFEHPRILRRFEVTDRLLSGRRPNAWRVEALGESVLEQLLYLVLLGDFATAYLGILNNVDPSPVELVETFKKELQ